MRTSKHYARAPLAAAVASALLLAGCGGGGGGGSAGGGDGGGGTPTAIAGKAADGYLVGATVCLDLNDNKTCDTGEPSDTTAAGGAYTLDVPAGTDAAAYAVVVEVSAETVDEDTGAAVGKPYVLSAPPGKPEFVSPLTTAVHAIVEKNPALSVDEAASVVKAQVGAGEGVSLFEDYVAAKQDDEAYDRLHKVAQVSGKVLAANQEAILAAATTQGVDTEASFAELLALVVQQVLDQLEQSAETVDGVGDEFDIDKVSVDVADTTNLQDQLDEAEAVAGFTTLSAQTLLANGGHWIWGRPAEGDSPAEYEYGWVQANPDQAGKLDEEWYIHDPATGWQQQFDDEAKLFLGSAGWQMASDTAPFFDVSYSADGSARLALPSVDVALKLSASQLDVSGKPVKTYLQFEAHQPFAAVMSGEPSFSAGAKVYQVAFVVDQDQYSIDLWADCDAAVADPGGECNVIFGKEGLATSFAELTYATGAPPGNWFGVGDGLSVWVYEGGVLRIVDDNDLATEHSGTWTIRTVHGRQLMMLTLPERFRSRLWDDGQPFLAVQNGYVRRGAYLAEGTIEDAGEVWFNGTAWQDIETAFDEGVGVADPADPADPVEPAGEVPADLVGSWYLIDGEDYMVLNIWSDGRYLDSEGTAPASDDPTGEPGVEYGTLSVDADTGLVTASPGFDNNGTWGFSHQTGLTMARVGDKLTWSHPDDADWNFEFARAEDATNPLVGGWAMQGTGAGETVVITFTPTYYAVGETGTADAVGGPGVEFGTYTWDSGTHAFTVDGVLTETNGEWGLSHEAFSSIEVNGDTLTATDPGGATYTFLRIN